MPNEPASEVSTPSAATGTATAQGATSQAARQMAANRFQILNTFIDRTMRELSPSERAVWFILYRDSRPPDGLASTKQADLARRAGITDRQVRRAVEALKARGLLRIVRRGGPRNGVSSYRVLPQ